MADHKSTGRARSVVTAMLRRPVRRPVVEDGFTLVEMLMVIIILPLIIGAVTVVMITSLKATDTHDKQGTSQRLAESHDAQLTSAYFVRDVQSSANLEATNSTPLCTVASQTAAPGQTAVKELLGLEWNSGSTIVSYVWTKIGSSGAVVRNFCSGSAVASSTSTISHNVSSVNRATLTCNLVVDPGNLCQSDAGTGLIQTARVSTVEIDINESSGFVYKLIASPRQILGTSIGLAGSAPTLLLADGGNCGTGNISVNGTAAVNYGNLSFQNNNGSFSAQQVYEGVVTVNDGVLQAGSSTVTSATGPFNSAQVGEPIAGNGIPSGTTIKSVSSATQAKMTNNASANESNDSIQIGPNSAISPSSEYTGTTTSGTPIADPYANLPAPSPTGADTYVETSTFKPSGALTPGIYIIQAGMTIGGNGTVTVGATLGDGTDGVFFYVEGGSVTVGGTSNVNLSAISNGPYKSVYGGILIYQVPSDTSGMTLDGSSAVTTLDGVIAAPGATVTMDGGGNGGGLNAYGLEASSITCNGNNTTTILGPPENTTTTVASSMNPSNNGSTVTFTATVVASGGITPNGTVTFTQTPNGGVTVAMAGCSNLALNSSGQATCTTSTLVSAGSVYTITATFTPSGGGLLASSGSLPGGQKVNSFIATSTAVTSNVNPSSAGQAITYTATVTPASVLGALTGTVTFKDGATTITCGAGSQAFSGTTDTATCIATPSAGKHSITATYSGDTVYAASTSPTYTQYVNPMHISFIQGSKSKNGSNWSATIAITVVDGSNPAVPLNNVVVTGTWSTSGGGAVTSCTTGTNGQCPNSGSKQLSSGNLSTTSVSSVTFTVTSVTLSGYIWYPPADTADSVTVTFP